MKRLQSVGAVLGALSAVAAGAVARADTIIPGGSIINQTWTTAGSPYVIQGDITVPAGAFLTIQPGVTVQVATFDVLASGFDTSKVEIIIKGTLTVNGTSALPVTFQAQTGIVAGSWWGIYADPTAASVGITGAVIRHAVNGVISNAPGSALSVSQTTVQICQASGIAVNAGTPTFSRLTVSGCATGVSIGSSANATIQNSTFFLNSTAGVQSDAASGSTNIVCCTLDTNGSYGVRSNGLGTLGIYNSIVARGAGYGVYRAGVAPVTVASCDVWSNSASNFFGVAPGAGTISADPLLTAVGDPHLLAGSVCIDAGDSVHCVSPDLFGANRPADGDGIGGAQCDMGCSEFGGCSSTSITANPGPVTVRVGRPFTLTAGATGSSLTYQWRLNSTNVISARGLTGAKGPMLSVDMAGLYDAGPWDCVVTGACGSQTTLPATVTVLSACAADFSGDGVLAVQDIFEFLNAWFAGCP